MIRALATFFATLALVLGLAASPAEAAIPPRKLGPGDAKVHDIGDEALIRTSKFGYVYIAGQQNSHLTITFDQEANALRYRDTGTKRLTTIPRGCDRKKAERGIEVLCKVPARFDGKKMFVQVWPRLGNDYVDGRTLPRKFRLWVLADAGRDVIFGGKGDDFVNAAFDADKVFGGTGNDFLRAGPGDDRVRGGTGRDRLVCSEGYDVAFRDRHDSMYMCDRVLRG